MSACGLGFDCAAIFNHSGRPAADRLPTSPGSHCPVTAPSQPIKMSSVTVPCCYVSQKKPTARPPTEISNLGYLLQALYCKGHLRCRIVKHFISTLKYLLDPWCATVALNPTKSPATTVSFAFCWDAVFTLDHSISYKASGI